VTDAVVSPEPEPNRFWPGPWPGLLLTAAIAAAAFGLRVIPGVKTFSTMILAMVLGMAIHNLMTTPKIAKAGVAFSQKRVLRLAIILLGLQLTVRQVVEVGGPGVAILVTGVLATFAFTVWLGRVLGVDRRLAELIGAGTSICGASAIIATNTVTHGSDEDVAYALATVTLFGTICIFTYPIMKVLLGLDVHAYGLWAGSSIHEVAQVVAAAFQGGPDAGKLATVVKLTRVMMLAPMVLGLGAWAARRAMKAGGEEVHARPPVPWFVFGFIAMMLLNSLVAVPPAVMAPLKLVTTFLFTMALAAMGLETDVRKLKARGLRPLVLGATASLFICGLTLALIELGA
jgi:uncharacterized integral membrane protein (TIGR00698 family)